MLTFQAGDCQATVFGLQGFNLGDACATLGTGSFMMLNTGKYCHASVKGHNNDIHLVKHAPISVEIFSDIEFSLEFSKNKLR